jgi:hypothetical protein
MKFQLFQLIPLFLVDMLLSVHSVRIPDDIEILDGYRFDSQNILNPESAFFGSSGSVGPRLFKAIRDKRSIGKYEILESPGLRSHFRSDNSQKSENTFAKPEKRWKRDVDEEEKNSEGIDKLPTEELPTPEKFVSGNFRDSHKSMEQWGKSPYANEFSKVQKEEDDSQVVFDTKLLLLSSTKNKYFTVVYPSRRIYHKRRNKGTSTEGQFHYTTK